MKIISLLIVFNLFFLSTENNEEKNYRKVIQETELQKSIKRGKEVYTDMCVTCHLPNGKGVAKVYPPLAKSDYLMEKREASIRAIKYGIRGKIVVNDIAYKGIMASLGLYEDEVADLMNYITNSWGNKNPKMITEDEVNKVQKE
jgi:mono/diheme cytochrome c family protein